MPGQISVGGKQFVHFWKVVHFSECPFSEVLLYSELGSYNHKLGRRSGVQDFNKNKTYALFDQLQVWLALSLYKEGYKCKNHFYKMKEDVGMSGHEKERKQEDAYTKTQTHS